MFPVCNRHILRVKTTKKKKSHCRLHTVEAKGLKQRSLRKIAHR